MKRGGQFYLVASVILVVIIVSFITISNYAIKKNPSNVDTYGKELEIEIEKVFDYNEINGEDKTENFTKEYSEYLGSDIDSVYIIVDGNENEAYYFSDGVKVDATGNLSVAEEIIFDAGDSEYQFDLNKGKNFYFILSQNVEEEKYVYTN